MPCPCVRRVCHRTLESVFKTRSGMNRRAGRAIVLPVHRLEAAPTPLLYDERGGFVSGKRFPKRVDGSTRKNVFSSYVYCTIFRARFEMFIFGVSWKFPLARDCRDPKLRPSSASALMGRGRRC